MSKVSELKGRHRNHTESWVDPLLFHVMQADIQREVGQLTLSTDKVPEGASNILCSKTGDANVSFFEILQFLPFFEDKIWIASIPHLLFIYQTILV